MFRVFRYLDGVVGSVPPPAQPCITITLEEYATLHEQIRNLTLMLQGARTAAADPFAGRAVSKSTVQ